ncbi:MAG: CPBP family intramembrane metalloprotease, partial [Pyrinomonadaceae bacterium]|nr:CPBP family intramembrane metalloprotease [Pyrinomonadaceae bacterium]
MLFFVLAYAFSWVVWAPAVLFSRGASEEPQRLTALLHLAGALGPMASAFLVTALAGGSAGVGELLRRVFRWRVGLGWWVVAVVGTPILFLVAAVICRLLFGGWPDLGQFGRSEEFAFLGLLPYWLANILFYGFGEEVGWRGFALPRLQTGMRSALAAALILGLFWAAWHIPLFSFAMGFKSMGLVEIPGWFFSMLIGSVLLAWLYNSTGGSVLIVAIFHSTLDISITSPAGPQLTNVMGALVTIWGLAMLR